MTPSPHGLNISKSTVSDYLQRAKAAGINWPLPEEMTEQELYKILFLPAQSSKKERPLPNWDEVCQELRRKGVTLLLLWREYKDKYPNGLGYTQFCTRYRAHVKQISPVM